MNSVSVRPGRPLAFDRTLEAHYRRYYDKLVNKYKAEQYAEDIVQEAYTRAMEQWINFDFGDADLGSLEYRQRFATWFGSKILPQGRKEVVRKEYRHGAVNHEEFTPEIEDQIAPEYGMAEADSDEAYDIRRAIALIDRQKEPGRSILYLALIDEEHYDNIAKYVGVSVLAIKKRVQRFREELKSEDSVPRYRDGRPIR